MGCAAPVTASGRRNGARRAGRRRPPARNGPLRAAQPVVRIRLPAGLPCRCGRRSAVAAGRRPRDGEADRRGVGDPRGGGRPHLGPLPPRLVGAADRAPSQDALRSPLRPVRPRGSGRPGSGDRDGTSAAPGRPGKSDPRQEGGSAAANRSCARPREHRGMFRRDILPVTPHARKSRVTDQLRNGTTRFPASAPPSDHARGASRTKMIARRKTGNGIGGARKAGSRYRIVPSGFTQPERACKALCDWLIEQGALLRQLVTPWLSSPAFLLTAALAF